MNKVEFSRTAKAPFERRYGNYINGKWAEPRSGRYFENFSPVNGQLLCEIARSDANDIEARARCRARRQGSLGPHQRRRTRADPQPHRRPHGGKPRPARACRNLGQRQADPRDHGGRRAARHRSFPLLRRRHPRPGRRPLRDRPRHRRLSFPRAARRRRPDHSVELSAADGVLEAGAGAGRRQLRRAEAGRTDPGGDHGLGWT